jgi:hypothetical protein
LRLHAEGRCYCRHRKGHEQRLQQARWNTCHWPLLFSLVLDLCGNYHPWSTCGTDARSQPVYAPLRCPGHRTGWPPNPMARGDRLRGSGGVRRNRANSEPAAQPLGRPCDGERAHRHGIGRWRTRRLLDPPIGGAIAMPRLMHWLALGSATWSIHASKACPFNRCLSPSERAAASSQNADLSYLQTSPKRVGSTVSVTLNGLGSSLAFALGTTVATGGHTASTAMVIERR